MFIAVVHIKLPVARECPVIDIIIHLLVHGHRNPVNTDLQGDGSLRGCIYIAAIGPHASPGNPQQGRIPPRFRGILFFIHWYAENAIGTVVRQDIIERHLIHIHILGTTLRQQSFGRIEVGLPRLSNRSLPELLEIIRHHGRWLQLLR